MAASNISEAKFADALPLISDLMHELTLLTGLIIDCQKGGVDGAFWDLQCKKARIHIQLIPLEDVITYGIVSDPFSKWNPYLHESLLFVLIKLGGKLEDQLPAWAGLPWGTAKKNWNPSSLKGFWPWSNWI